MVSTGVLRESIWRTLPALAAILVVAFLLCWIVQLVAGLAMMFAGAEKLRILIRIGTSIVRHPLLDQGPLLAFVLIYLALLTGVML